MPTNSLAPGHWRLVHVGGSDDTQAAARWSHWLLRASKMKERTWSLILL